MKKFFDWIFRIPSKESIQKEFAEQKARMDTRPWQLLNQASVMRDAMKQGITESNFYCKNVKKSEWPKGSQISLKKSAVNSPDIYLEDLKYTWQVDDTLKQTGRVLQTNAQWLWANAFQNDILENCENRVLTHEPEFIFSREFSEDSVLVGSVKELERAAFWNKGKSAVENPPRVNFWGRRVDPYITSTCTGG